MNEEGKQLPEAQRHPFLEAQRNYPESAAPTNLIEDRQQTISLESERMRHARSGYYLILKKKLGIELEIV